MSGVIIGGFVALLIDKQLPPTENIRKIELKEPLRIYSADNKLIAEYGEERRRPIEVDATPDILVKAILASEDDQFYSHPGIDLLGFVRAFISNYKSGGTRQGASTITMQVARNYFLSAEQTYIRKLREVMLALKLESNLSKDDILKLYINKIFLGHRAYGFGAAAEVYYGKDLDQLTLAQHAMLAGLPKAPSRNNPISNPENAKDRRNYVLQRMLINGWIDDATYQTATNEPVTASKHLVNIELSAPYVAEMVRKTLLESYGEQSYWQGLKVFTSIQTDKQKAANQALRDGLIAYDKRHGYRGPVDSLAEVKPEEWERRLQTYQRSKGIIPAIVVKTTAKQAELLTSEHGAVNLSLDSAKWARKHRTANQIGSAPSRLDKLLSNGDVIYITRNEEQQWQLSQIPSVEGSIVSMLPRSGKIVALAGGFDYYFNKYNRVNQARRQPGSGIKPFIYAAALQKGFNPATRVSGAPIVIDDPSQGTVWRPQNYSGKFYGPTSLREALTRSMNIVSVRLLRAIGVDYAKDYLQQFGLSSDYLPNSLSLALGAGNLTPLEMATAYSALANTGYLVAPHVIERIEARDGSILFEQPKVTLCDSCQNLVYNDEKYIAPRVMSKDVNFLITNIMQDVIRRGTARKALVLERSDLAGKTGTTNDYIDAWFSGFSPRLTTTVWVGFDKPQTMGRAESGSRAALPIWIDYMREALRDIPVQSFAIPAGIVQRFDPQSQQSDYFLATNTGGNELLLESSSELPTNGSTPAADPNTNTGAPAGLF